MKRVGRCELALIRRPIFGGSSMTDMVVSTPAPRLLTAHEFQGLAELPPELEWLANIPNAKTRRAYKIDVSDFSAFVGIGSPAEMRKVTRAHVIAWRDHLVRQALAGSTIRRKLSAIS